VHPDSDARLVAAAKSGDALAARQLYLRHSPWVASWLRRRAGATNELDDLLQDVFIIALRSLHKLREPEAFRFWLLGIAQLSATSDYRKRFRSRRLAARLSEQLPPVSTFHEEQAALGCDVRRILEQLPYEERLVLVTYDMSGCSQLEGARACGMSLPTFKRRVASARLRFVAHAKRRRGLWSWLRRSVA
jgi:RNA polymerase sigma-70 factor (ECF subfamily)